MSLFTLYRVVYQFVSRIIYLLRSRCHDIASLGSSWNSYSIWQLHCIHMCWRVASTGIPQRREPKLLLSVPEVIALIYENTELTYKLLIINLF